MGGYAPAAAAPIVESVSALSRTARRGREQSGQAVVEFAVIANVLLVIIFAIYQIGVVFEHYIDVSDAARSGARAGSQWAACASSNGTAFVSGKVHTVVQQSTSLSTTDTTTDTQHPADQNWAPGDDINVTVSTPYNISLFGIGIANGTLKHTVTMRAQKGPTACV
jgi:Flp pilus assembly protein TadG